MEREITVFDTTLRIETRCTPVFTFICPQCKATAYEEIVDFDLETPIECPKCGYYEEAWMFPHTIDKTKQLWTVGGHYTNDSPAIMPLMEVVKQFLWCRRDELIFVHGCEPHVLGTLKECIEALRKAGYLEE